MSPFLDGAEDEDGRQDDGHVEVVVAGAEVVVHHQLQVLRDEDEVHAAEAELRQAQENVDQDSEIWEVFMISWIKFTYLARLMKLFNNDFFLISPQ